MEWLANNISKQNQTTSLSFDEENYSPFLQCKPFVNYISFTAFITSFSDGQVQDIRKKVLSE